MALPLQGNGIQAKKRVLKMLPKLRSFFETKRKQLLFGAIGRNSRAFWTTSSNNNCAHVLGAVKKVQVQMTDECHAVLKAYAGFFQRTMSEILYMFARQEIQHQAVHCQFVQGLLDAQGITPDKRVSKPCWGHKCLMCVHAAKCTAGLTDKTFKPQEGIKAYLKPESPVWDLYES